MAIKQDCEYCLNYSYDEETEEYSCSINMDEDDYARLFFSAKEQNCPYFRFGDEYTIVRKQN